MLAPLVGRDEMLARAARLLDERSGGLVLVGEGGVGKSRLASEIVRLGEDRGSTPSAPSAPRPRRGSRWAR